jgi:hypothetical protein
MPYTNSDEPSLTLDEAGRKGYCMHANILFPPWHRPYLLLYEQSIHEIMVKDIFPEQPKHRQAEWTELAKTWRLPCWNLSLLSLPVVTSSADIKSEASFDVLLSMMLLPKRRVIQCYSKLAHHGFIRDTELKPG